MKITTYPDGSSYVDVDFFEDYLQNSQANRFTFKINSYNDLWKLGNV